MLVVAPRPGRAPRALGDARGRGPRESRKADVVARDLMRRIVRGELPVGALLPREPDLAATYGTSRSVVREAVKLLEVHKLVRPTRRLGTEVLDPAASMSPEVLAVMLSPSPGVIDTTVLEGLLEVRAQLDVQMAALAAKRRTRADLQALDAGLGRLRELVGDAEAYATEASGFGLLLARAAHNPVFGMLAHWNQSVVSELDHVLGVVRHATEPHRQGLETLVDAIRRRDAKSARQLVATFHEWATPRILAAAALANGSSTKKIISELRSR